MVQLGMILRVIRTIGAPAVVSGAPIAREAPVAREELVADIMAEFRVFIGELRCAGTERLLKAGVSMTNLHVLSLLSQHGEMSMSRLADLLDVSLSNATGLMDRMEERALVERVRVSDDRRIVLVRLTEGGRTTLEEAEIVKGAILERVLGHLDDAQLSRLAQCLTDIHAAVAADAADEVAGASGRLSSLIAHVNSHAQPVEAQRPGLEGREIGS
jgi:MarR family transcriptional regulator, organic hydroperoxide resistance regulator